MHKLEGKKCPFYNQECLLIGCTFFNEMLQGCEISGMNYNLYQLKEHIRAWLDRVEGVPEGIPMIETDPSKSPRYPRPAR